jgi:lipopolysaccharide/colanic/teichoic acid biosynthesis glycosyltransferase
MWRGAEQARPRQGGRLHGKRTFDVVFAVVLLLALLPVLLIVAVTVKLGYPGPLLARETRLGRGAEPFGLLRFRAEPGTWLTRSGLVELPRLLGVLLGDLSVVGPRPVRVDEVPADHARFLVAPGLTGLAQVSGAGRAAALDLDARYARTHGAALDALILARTPLAAVRPATRAA